MFRGTSVEEFILRYGRLILAGLLLCGLCLSLASDPAAAKRKKIKPPKAMTTKYLKTPAAIELGEKIWRKQCQHCHGAKAYPGKAPKLKPRRYRPSFVWDRVTNGYRKMPRWDHVFSEEERMGLVAYILSRSFSP